MTDFNAILELAEPDPERAEDIVDQLHEFSASASPTLTRRLALTLTVSAEGIAQATKIALGLAATLEQPLTALQVLSTADYDHQVDLDALAGVVSVSEAATELGVSRQAVLQRLDAGTLAGRKAGQGWLISRSALTEAVSRKRRPPAPARTEVKDRPDRKGHRP